MAKLTREEALRYLGGTASEVADDLRQFANAARVLSSNHPRFIDECPQQWVGVYQGRVATSAKSLKALMAKMEQGGIPTEKAIVRFIDRDETILIL